MPESITIVCFGDSTTAPRKTVEAVYAARLPELLAAGGLRSRVINAGVGGSHTGRLVDNDRHRREHALDRLDSAVRAHDPDLVLLQFGINDSWVDGSDPNGPSRIPLDDCEENLRSIVRTLRVDGAGVILMTPKKVGGRHEPWRVMRLGRFAAAVRRVACTEGAPLVDVWAAYEDFEWETGRDRAALMLDGTHPNDEGHELVAKIAARRILRAAAVR